MSQNPNRRSNNPNDYQDYAAYGSYLGGGSSNPNPQHQVPNIFPQFPRGLTIEQQHELFLQQQRGFEYFQHQRGGFQQFNVPETSPETVPETPPEETTPRETQKQKRKHKKKEIARPASRKVTKWSSQEEAWLAQCWVDSSEDSRVGNSQRRQTLWGTISAKFNNNNFGWSRGDDQLTSKWRIINKCCGEFNAIYNEVRRNWRSGEGDADVLLRAHQQYKNNYLKQFTMMDCWYVLKDKPKWYAPAPVGGNVDAFEDELFPPLSADNELFGDDPFERPTGRERSKKAARTSQSSDAPTSSSRSSKNEDILESIKKTKEEVAAKKKQTLDEVQRQEKLRTAFAGASILSLSTKDMERKKDRKLVNKLKILFHKKFSSLLESEDDDDEDED